MANYPMYPYMSQRPQPYMTDSPVIKGRPVSSFEEARASMIDFDGSVFYFPDLANQKIYTKQINMDGTPSLKIYELAAMPQQQLQSQVNLDHLVTKEEFEKTVNDLLQQIKALEQPAPVPVAAGPAQEFKF